MVLSKARTIIGFLTEATDFESTDFAESADFAEATDFAEYTSFAEPTNFAHAANFVILRKLLNLL